MNAQNNTRAKKKEARDQKRVLKKDKKKLVNANIAKMDTDSDS